MFYQEYILDNHTKASIYRSLRYSLLDIILFF